MCVLPFNRRRTPMATLQTLLGLATVYSPATYDMLYESERPRLRNVPGTPSRTWGIGSTHARTLPVAAFGVNPIGTMCVFPLLPIDISIRSPDGDACGREEHHDQ
jgi:hypothetical protein